MIESMHVIPLTLAFRDTVSSVGIIPRRLPFTKANNNIRYFRHALALDEHRAYVLGNLVNRRGV